MTGRGKNLPEADRSPWLTVADVAARLRLTEYTVRVMARSGQIPGVKLGRLWRFRQAEFDRWANRRTA